jgi:ribosomal-protein-serine acetyltransferase
LEKFSELGVGKDGEWRMSSMAVSLPLSGGTWIRNFESSNVDAQALNEAVDSSREHLRPWMPWASHPPMSVEARKELLATWVADERNTHLGAFAPDGRVVAGIGAHDRNAPGEIEIGYWVRVDVVRQGLATRISGAVTTAVFALAPTINRVLIKHDVANVPSGRIPARLGFVKIGEFERPIDAPGQRGLTYVWAMERTAWHSALRAR